MWVGRNEYWRLIKLTKYKRRYSYDRSMEFVTPLLALIFLGVMYVVMVRIGDSHASFILLSVASGLVVYWAVHLRRLARVEEQAAPARQVEQKSWVYDLIKGSDELVFVAEVPGPEDQVNVRLVNGVLYIRGGQNFGKDVLLDVSEDMSIAEFKYRNGVLTLKIRKM